MSDANTGNPRSVSAAPPTPPLTSLDIALALAAAGLPVFPCNGRKTPAIAKANGGNGFHDASTDPNRVRELWDLAGGAGQLVGVPTGDASGFDVLDFDPRHGSDDWRAANIHRLPETRVHATPGLPKVPTDPVMPGEHWLFRHVDGVRNGASDIAPGVDVRGTGGYVCFPPAGGYSVVHEADVADWPDWLLPLVLKAAEPATRQEGSRGATQGTTPYTKPPAVTDKRVNRLIESLLENIRRAAEGAKHPTLWDNGLSIGGYLHHTDWTDEDAVEKCIQALPDTVKDWNAARRTAAQAIAAGRLKPLTLEDRPEYTSRRYPPRTNGGGNGATPPELEPPTIDGEAWETAPDAPEPHAQEEHLPDTEPDGQGDAPPPEWNTDTGANGEAVEAEDAGEGAGEAEAEALVNAIPPDDVINAIAELGPNNTTRRAIVALFNKRYAVAYEGGKTPIIWFAFDPVLKRDIIERAGFEEFRKLYSNRKLTVSIIGPEGKPKNVTKSFADWWLEDPNRRQYIGGVAFAPGAGQIPHVLNLWRDWAIKPAPGDWSLMSAHIHEVICGGRTEVSSYVLRWLAHMVQHPSQPGEVAIVVRGLKGVGKGIFGKWLLRLCGQHGLHITNAVHLTGRFTGHLRDVVFVLADEAFFAGDKQHEGILKAIITEDQLVMEAKYRTAGPAANMLHLMMFSNNDWVVPASQDERRYLMMEATADHKGDFPYFAALDAQMENGGLAAMLHDLQAMDLGDFHPRRSVPNTPELAEQKEHSMDSVHRWWTAVLARGFVWKSRYGHRDFLAWDEFVTTELLARSYAQWCQENRINYPAHRELVGKRLSAIYPQSRPRSEHAVYEADSIDRDDSQPVVRLPNQHGYRVGPLDTAREVFSKAIGRAAETSEWDSPVS